MRFVALHFTLPVRQKCMMWEGRGTGALKAIRNACLPRPPHVSAGPGFDGRGRQACGSLGATRQHQDQQRCGHALQTEGLQSGGIAGAHHQHQHLHLLLLLIFSLHLCGSLLLHQVSSAPCLKEVFRVFI